MLRLHSITATVPDTGKLLSLEMTTCPLSRECTAVFPNMCVYDNYLFTLTLNSP